MPVIDGAGVEPSAPGAQLADLLVGEIAGLLESMGANAELDMVLARWGDRLVNAADGAAALAQVFERPMGTDRRLLALVQRLSLAPFEIMAVVLAQLVEGRFEIGRAISVLQAPVGRSRPTLGFVETLLGDYASMGTSIIEGLINGPAVRSGLLELGQTGQPLPEQTIVLPAHLLAALGGRETHHPEAKVGPAIDPDVLLPPSILEQAAQHARGLVAASQRTLVIRSGSQAEARAVSVSG